MWERACSRMRRVSQHMRQLTHRIREQARSHIWFSVSTRGIGAARCRCSNPANARLFPAIAPACRRD
ncbi:hypothetical protein C1X84_09550 [Pseudomonas sp. GP01-A1]|nr:hypothetical protein C1X84_09550 [Pseudomonas sp. GP01-A1]PMU84869.1 hypothetical protein C1X91_02640 [Pseudomonas sp. GP01-A5]PMV11949.1 hypothetical protein C1X83_12765 [Pseudomonas sp. GP01-A4]QBQ13228.1 hypothetical protein DCC84_27380 [Pseudomonas sp. SXM-1]